MISDLKNKLASWDNLPEYFDIKEVSGGDINMAFEIKSPTKKFFVKVQQQSISDLFEKEAKGLELLKSTAFVVPRVEYFNEEILVLEWLEKAAENENYFLAAGKALAEMHKTTQTKFGLDHNNYIATLPQINEQTSSWIDFYITNRIEPQLKIAVDKRLWDPGVVRRFNRFYAELENLLPVEKPALLHGDLWSGNIMGVYPEKPAIYDPAVYFGHREMDLAMTKLFGGFSTAFYEAYEHEFPLEPGFQNRVSIHQLYPIMVHVNLFGGGYLTQAEQIISRYC